MTILILTMALVSQNLWHSSGVGAASGTGGLATHEFKDLATCVSVGEAWEARMKHHPEYDSSRAFYLCVKVGG